MLTGATGFYGQAFINAWRESGLGFDLLALSRSHDELKTIERNSSGAVLMSASLGYFFRGQTLELNPSALIHAAANTQWNVSLQQARTQNFNLSRKVVRKFLSLNSGGRVIFISTALAGEFTTQVSPRYDRYSRKFHNFYEMSKFESEQMVREECANFAILRPPLIAADSSTLWAVKYQGIYLLLKAFSKGLLPIFPCLPQAIPNVVPINSVIQDTLRLLQSRESKDLLEIRATSGVNFMQFTKIFAHVINCRNANIGRPFIAAPRIVSYEQWLRLFRPLIRQSSRHGAAVAGVLEYALPYFFIQSYKESDFRIQEHTFSEKYASSIVNRWATENI